MKLFMIAGMMSLIAGALFLRPQTADTQDDSDDIVFLTRKNIGKISLKNETVWFRCEIDRKYCGHAKWKIENKGSGTRIATYFKLDYKEGDYYEHTTVQDESILSSGSPLPVSESYKMVHKAYKTYFRIEKQASFDWKRKTVTIVTGDEAGRQSRTIALEDEGFDWNAVLFRILDKKTLVPGKGYRFYAFSIQDERVLLRDFFVSRKLDDKAYEIVASFPTSFGTGGVTSFWAGPKSDKKPNGEILRISAGNIILTKSTEAKALNKPPKKKKKK